MKVVNKGVEEGEEPVISSRYSVVMATAKRARQIIAGDEPMVKVKDKQKPLSIAVEEMNQDTLRILTDEEKDKLENADVAEEVESTEEN
ncbi:DNA-directed RNA polymerase subunit omega [Butyrivibrio hungatei]|nr:DNA-directed RNA polymerase subunit omega [Butyrivibrio hungatei]